MTHLLQFLKEFALLQSQALLQLGVRLFVLLPPVKLSCNDVILELIVKRIPVLSPGVQSSIDHAPGLNASCFSLIIISLFVMYL